MQYFKETKNLQKKGGESLVMKITNNKENGITLIALIITIIILVILAAVSVRAVYEMGIVNHAVNGTQQYAQKAVEENQILGDTSNLIENTLEKLNNIQEDKSKKAYRVGDYIKINGEGFYVIEDSQENQTTVKLLAEKNVDTSTNKQSSSVNSLIFDSSATVYENSSIKHLVDEYVSALGVEVVSARLLTLDDMYDMGLVEPTYGSIRDCPSFVGLTDFWLGSTFDSPEYGTLVWFVNQGGDMEAWVPNDDSYYLHRITTSNYYFEV